MKNKHPIRFLILYTLIFTLPVMIFFFSKIPGKYADTYQVWGKTIEFRNMMSDLGMLETLKWQVVNFRFSPIEIIGWLQKLTNPEVGYNLFWLFSFFLAAYGMYLLVYYLTRNYYAALIAGVIFAFSPFHFAQAVSTNIGTMNYQWIPFFVLFMIKFFRGLRLRDFLKMLFFLVLIAATEHQLLAFTLVFTLIFVIAFLIKNYSIFAKPKFWAYALVGVAVLLLAIKLLFGGLLDVANSQENYLDPGSDQVKRYSADAIEIFIPSAFHPFLGEKYNYLRENTEANSLGRQSIYLGYAVVLLALISLLGFRKRFGIKIFFFAAAVFFIFLSFGPYLHWKGEINENIWMPYKFLYEKIPYWYIIRTVNRIYVIALFCLAVSAGFGLNSILGILGGRQEEEKEEEKGKEREKEESFKEEVVAAKKSKEAKAAAAENDKKTKKAAGKEEEAKQEKGGNKKVKIKQKRISISPLAYRKKSRARQEVSVLALSGWARGIFWIFLLIVSFEYLSLPVPTIDMSYSQFYDQLAEQPGDFSIIDIPGSTSYDYASKSMIFNQIHRKKNWAGMDLARVVEDQWDFQSNTPIFNDLLYTLPGGGSPPSKEIINDYYYNLATKILNHYNVKYIIVSKSYLKDDKKFDGPAFENTLIFIDGEIDAKQVYEDDFLIAFKVQSSEHLDGWFLAMDLKGDYWGEKNGKEGSVTRWARDGAKLRVVNMGPDSKNLNLHFDTSINNLRTIEIQLNGVTQEKFAIKEEKETHNVSLKDVKPGENEVLIRMFDPDGNPVETYELKRGVKFSDLRLTETGAPSALGTETTGTGEETGTGTGTEVIEED